MEGYSTQSFNFLFVLLLDTRDKSEFIPIGVDCQTSEPTDTPFPDPLLQPSLHNCVAIQNLPWREQPSDTFEKYSLLLHYTSFGNRTSPSTPHSRTAILYRRRRHVYHPALWTYNGLWRRERLVSVKPLYMKLTDKGLQSECCNFLYLGGELRLSVRWLWKGRRNLLSPTWQHARSKYR